MGINPASGIIILAIPQQTGLKSTIILQDRQNKYGAPNSVGWFPTVFKSYCPVENHTPGVAIPVKYKISFPYKLVVMVKTG